MKKTIYLILLLTVIMSACKKAEFNKTTPNKTTKDNSQKVFLITLDGLRWQELFTGADSVLVRNKEYVHDKKKLIKEFWRNTPEKRRATLMPFIWNTVTKIGQIHGNRHKGSKMNLTNKMHFSYPGYNEILTGKADDINITSNDKIPNPNTTILELAEKSERYSGKVAVFGSWDVFPSIINEERSGLYVNAGFRKAKGNNLTTKELFLNELQDEIPSPWDAVRLDAFTHEFALEEIKKTHPKLVYIAYGETDDFAHDGHYDAYLKATRRADNFINELWNYTQQDDFYKGNTTFIITTDHGRGTQPIESWKHHSKNIEGCDQVWLIAFGTKIDPKGEISNHKQIYTNQIARSIAKLLNIKTQNTQMGKPFDFIN